MAGQPKPRFHTLTEANMLKPQIAWIDEPIDDLARVCIKIQNPKPNCKVYGLPLGNKITGVLTHYIGKTIPCRAPQACEPCTRFVPARYKGYLPCVTIDGKQRFIMELQKKNAEFLTVELHRGVDLTAFAVRLERVGKHRNAPVQSTLIDCSNPLTLEWLRQNTEGLTAWPVRPPYFDPRQNLMAMWGYTRSQIELELFAARSPSEEKANPPFEKLATPGGENHDPRI